MPEPSVEWVPGSSRFERGFLLVFRFGLVLAACEVAALILSGFGLIPIPFSFSMALLPFVVLLPPAFLILQRRRGFYGVGISPAGISIKVPLGTRTFVWSELIWYGDSMQVEGRSAWRGPPLLSLTPAQFQRIQRAYYGS